MIVRLRYLGFLPGYHQRESYGVVEQARGVNEMGLFGPKRHSKSIGEYSEVVIAERLLKAGYNVLTPYGDSLRYDLVIEDADGKFWRVQCKTAWMDKRTGDEVVKFATSSSHYHYRGGKYN